VVDLDSAKYSGMSDVELVEDRGCEHHELPIACLMAEASLRRRWLEPGNLLGLDARTIMTRSKQ
jgi:hypothetical protein